MTQTDPTRKQPVPGVVSPTAEKSTVAYDDRNQSKSPVTYKMATKAPVPTQTHQTPSKSPLSQTTTPQPQTPVTPTTKTTPKPQISPQSQVQQPKIQQPTAKVRPIVETTKFDSLEVSDSKPLTALKIYIEKIESNFK